MNPNPPPPGTTPPPPPPSEPPPPPTEPPPPPMVCNWCTDNSQCAASGCQWQGESSYCSVSNNGCCNCQGTSTGGPGQPGTYDGVVVSEATGAYFTQNGCPGHPGAGAEVSVEEGTGRFSFWSCDYGPHFKVEGSLFSSIVRTTLTPPPGHECTSWAVTNNQEGGRVDWQGNGCTAEFASSGLESGTRGITFRIRPTDYAVCGRVVDDSGQALPAGVPIYILNGSTGQAVQETTGPNGTFSNSQIVDINQAYAVRLPGNSTATLSPAGYARPGVTSTSSFARDQFSGSDTPLNSLSYESQRAGALDCAGPDSSGTSCRCNFVYVKDADKVCGYVRNADQEPVAGKQIKVTGYYANGTISGNTTFTTGSTGFFSVPASLPGQALYDVEIVGTPTPGETITTATITRFTSGPSTKYTKEDLASLEDCAGGPPGPGGSPTDICRCDFEVDTGPPKVCGRVIDGSSNEGLKDIQVRLSTESRAPLGEGGVVSTLTDAEGRYCFENTAIVGEKYSVQLSDLTGTRATQYQPNPETTTSTLTTTLGSPTYNEENFSNGTDCFLNCNFRYVVNDQPGKFNIGGAVYKLNGTNVNTGTENYCSITPTPPTSDRINPNPAVRDGAQVRISKGSNIQTVSLNSGTINNGTYMIYNVDPGINTVELLNISSSAAPTTYACQCNPDGANTTSCLYTVNVNADKTVDFFVHDLATTPLARWWQVVGGNTYAGLPTSTTQTAFTAQVPPSQTCVAPGCVPYFSSSGIPNAIETAGVVVTGGAKAEPANALTERPRTNTQLNGSTMTQKENFAYFSKLYDLSDTTTPHTGGGEPSAGSGHYYHRNDDLIITQPWVVGGTAPESYVIFVEKNLKLNGPGTNGQLITVKPGSFLAFIVKGDIIVENTVGHASATTSTPNIEGVYIADSKFIVRKATSGLERRFVGAGTFVGWSGVELERDFRSITNNTTPVMQFRFRPDFLKHVPEQMTSSRYVWQESN